MDFVSATDALFDYGVTLQEIADALGVSYSAARAARLPKDSSSYRRPPHSWRPMLVRLARQRGGDLTKLADRLERGA